MVNQVHGFLVGQNGLAGLDNQVWGPLAGSSFQAVDEGVIEKGSLSFLVMQLNHLGNVRDGKDGLADGQDNEAGNLPSAVFLFVGLGQVAMFDIIVDHGSRQGLFILAEQACCFLVDIEEDLVQVEVQGGQLVPFG